MAKNFLVLTIVAFAFYGTLNSQVTIGANKMPESCSLLEIDATYTKGGLRLPHLTTAERNNLTLNKNSKGLTIYNTETDCNEFWNGEEWKSVCGSIDKAEFIIPECSLIEVNGTYYNGTTLAAGNYLTIPINVTKVGTYKITIVPSPANGYYFIASGEFLTTGMIEVTAAGQGTPVNFTPAGELGDSLTISVNGADLNCTNKPRIIIGNTNIRPQFSIACHSIQVLGVIKKNVPLNRTNRMTMRLNVRTDSQGSVWECHTDKIDGISFKGSGTLGAAGTQEITLYGEGTTFVTSPKEFTIYTNSESTKATCKIVVVPVIVQKKIVEFAQNKGETYGLASGSEAFGGGPKQLLEDNMNYGDDLNSIVKYEGFSNINHISGLPVATTLKNNYCTGANAYDVIIITYNETPNQSQREVLREYVNAGGVLIYLDQNLTANNAAMVGDIFGENLPVPVSVGTNCNYLIKINTNIDDEITDGPFGDMRNAQWGEDYNNTCALTKIPRGAIVYSYVTNAYTGNSTLSNSGKVTMLRHPSKNFFWCGDSGLIDAPANSGQNTDNTTCPFKLGSVSTQDATYPHYPIDKENYGNQAAASRMPVCNSTIFANLMAWALKMAEENGINSGK